MKLFADELLTNFDKWHNYKFIKEQLLKHTEEVSLLIETNDNHQFSEIIDLMVISEIYLRSSLSQEDLDKIISIRKMKIQL